MLNFKKERINWRGVLGNSGTVHPYQKNEQDEKWAVKVIKTPSFQEASHYLKQIVLGFNYDNPYVLPVKGYLIDQDKQDEEWQVCIKVPRATGGSLRDIMNKYQKEKKLIPEPQIVQYFFELVCGIQYLHQRGIVHRNILPENILLDKTDGVIKIANFEIADIIEDEAIDELAEKIGTVNYTAPENRDFENPLYKKDLFRTDLWSLGIVIFELCTQMELRNLVRVPKERLEENLKVNLYKLQQEKKYSTTLISLIEGLLRVNPKERKSLKEIQETLIKNYGFYLKYTEGDLEKMQKELLLMKENEKYHKEIIANMEAKLKEMKKALDINQAAHSEFKEVQQSLKLKLQEMQRALYERDNNVHWMATQCQDLNRKLAETQKSLDQNMVVQANEQNLKSKLEEMQQNSEAREKYIKEVEKQYLDETGNLKKKIEEAHKNLTISEMAQNELRNSVSKLNLSLEQMQKEARAKDACFLDLKQHHQEKIEKLENKLESTQNKYIKAKNNESQYDSDSDTPQPNGRKNGAAVII